MTNYTGFENFTNGTLTELLQAPTSADSFFWLEILLALWVIFTLTLLFKEEEKLGLSNFLSCCAIASLVTMFIGLIFSLMGILTTMNFLYLLIFGGFVIIIWWLTPES